ncbi:uncharacterized protein CLBA1 [Xenopus laevis]|uniref:Uncharacterized protein CLBA1 n=2 Tax=Xenopus laevis TaxID=8355 RepID=A0A1L8EZY2_XENLA|nr:uncharacterized protein CLBA1 [Xenopus laevis]XP_018087793.1 uncharacterized protein CLBA1 [Xenopus laevis]OCT64916.1 hypothetical protein XELAEV_18041154mg [Xenopus laevis]
MKDINVIGINVNRTYIIPDPFSAIVDDSCLVSNLARSEDLYQDYCSHKELSGTWGDFESFSDCPPESERFYYKEGDLHVSSRHHLAECRTTTSKEAFSSEQTEFPLDWDALISTQEDSKAFQLSFPDIPVEQCTDEIKTLQNPLASLNGDFSVGDLINMQFRADCHSLDSLDDSPATSQRFEWKNSQGSRNLLLLLGVDPSEKYSVDGNQTKNDSISTDHDLSSVNESSHPNGTKSLIQTKLHVAPDSRQGSIFSYQFFVKTSATNTPLLFLTVSGKKSFFSTNHLRFNF